MTITVQHEINYIVAQHEINYNVAQHEINYNVAQHEITITILYLLSCTDASVKSQITTTTNRVERISLTVGLTFPEHFTR